MQLSPTERRMKALDQAAYKFEYYEDEGFLCNKTTGHVFDTPNATGQIMVTTPTRVLTAQQVIWYMMTGLDPNERGARMCHKDGNAENNRTDNLQRLIGPMIDRAPYGNNMTAPFAGVSLHKKSGKYMATFRDQGKLHYVQGLHDSPFEAKWARDEAVNAFVAERYEDFPITIEEALK